MDFDKNSIDAALAARLVAAQFPRWAELPVRPVRFGGWDNRTFHLGDDMSVRLPSAAPYALQVEKEQRWLPKLTPLLPVPIPVPLAMGVPNENFPWPWSIYRWIDGDTATVDGIVDMRAFATALGEFVAALQKIDATGGPPPGQHNFFRGGPPAYYDGETREAIAALGSEIDRDAVTEVWERGLASTWQGEPVWFHGDVSNGNLLVRDGRLSAVIDFGTSGVGDPACDLYICWTFLDADSRGAFRAALPLDDATWARGRAWTLWKALITLAQQRDANAAEAAKVRRVIAEILADHRRGG